MQMKQFMYAEFGTFIFREYSWKTNYVVGNKIQIKLLHNLIKDSRWHMEGYSSLYTLHVKVFL